MSARVRVLVVDDDPVVRASCERVLGAAYEVRTVGSGREGLAALAAGECDLALVDLKLPDLGGLDILREAPDRFPDVPLIIITGYSTVRSAVEAIKTGAFDYLAKPFTPDELEAAVEKALRHRRLLRGYRELQEAVTDRYQVSRLLGESPAMKRVLELVEQVARTESTVLITGESGTGKELVARAIHFSSPRRDARFVAVDCGAIAPSLMASELFGHVKGAFTGAAADRQGLMPAADGGSLFLDEVGNLPPDLQAALLRALETREVRPVGAERSVKVDARCIAASNRDLGAEAAAGRFREDLFYRLNVFPIRLPPLRERAEDIPVLARHFLALYAARMHKVIEDFTPEALKALTEYSWPGNVRELSNVVERLVILCGESRVGRAHLGESLAAPAPAAEVPRAAGELQDLKRKLRDQAGAEVERAFLLEALRRNGYNVTRAAAQTGMQRSNFQALLKKHNLRIRDIIGHEP
jgi:DNA-binding NtrC family response regulator